MYCPVCLPEGPSAGDDPKNPRIGEDAYTIPSGEYEGQKAMLRPKANGYYECPRCKWTNRPAPVRPVTTTTKAKGR